MPPPCLQLLAAVTSLAVVADFVVEKHESTLMWWEIVVISCASVSAFAAMVLMMFQVRAGGRVVVCMRVAGPELTLTEAAPCSRHAPPAGDVQACPTRLQPPCCAALQGGRSDRGCAGPRSKLGVVASLAGAAAHVGMLAAYSAYLCRYWSLASWYGAAYIANNLSANAYSSAAAVPTTSLTTTAALTTSLATTHNAFDYFSDWAAKWQVMYVFGCAIGAAFWLLALIFACCDAGAAQRRQVRVWGC